MDGKAKQVGKCIGLLVREDQLTPLYSIFKGTKFKTLPGSKNGMVRVKFPQSPYVVFTLQSIGMSISRDLLSWAVGQISQIPLLPYQVEGVQAIEKAGGRFLLADDPGLGKTAQALSWVKRDPENHLPVLAVVPCNIAEKWGREVEKWTRFSFTILRGTTAQPEQTVGKDILILPHSCIARQERKRKGLAKSGKQSPDWKDHFKKHPVQSIIVDESHMYANRGTKRTQALRSIVRKSKHVVFMTGTPVIRSPLDYWTILNMIHPKEFPSYHGFGERYTHAEHNGFGWNYVGSKNEEELLERIDPFYIRRTKRLVSSEIPDLRRSVVPMVVKQSNAYKQKQRSLLSAQTNNAVELLGMMEKMRIETWRMKSKSVCEWVHDFLEGSEEKLIVFTCHKEAVKDLMVEFPKMAVFLDGSSKDKDAPVQEFQNNPLVRLFIGNVEAAGIGADLFAANNVAFAEIPWTPKDIIQCEGRSQRKGQKNFVNSWILAAQGTIDEKSLEVLERKSQIVSKVTSDISGVTRKSILHGVLNSLKSF